MISPRACPWGPRNILSGNRFPTGPPVGTPKYAVRESLRWIPFDKSAPACGPVSRPHCDAARGSWCFSPAHVRGKTYQERLSAQGWHPWCSASGKLCMVWIFIHIYRPQAGVKGHGRHAAGKTVDFSHGKAAKFVHLNNKKGLHIYSGYRIIIPSTKHACIYMKGNETT